MFLWTFATVLLVSKGANTVSVFNDAATKSIMHTISITFKNRLIGGEQQNYHRRKDTSNISLCSDNDKACLLSTANIVYQQLMKGVPELNIAPNDPAYLPLVDAEREGLKYKFSHGMITGMDKCKISSVDYNPDELKIRAQVSCPKIVVDSQYEANGTLLMVPVHGKGECLVVTGEYNLNYYCSYEVSDNDVKMSLNIDKCRLNVDAVGPMVFEIDNLFDGNKKMSDAFHDFLHDNWKVAHDMVKNPVWEVYTQMLLPKLNKVLNHLLNIISNEMKISSDELKFNFNDEKNSTKSFKFS